MGSPEFAPGIQDPKDYGAASSLRRGSLVPMVIQKHEAARAGLHRDLRIGKRKMLSWALKQPIPKPGERRAVAFQTPLHNEWYKEFQGNLSPGTYGAGKVTREDLGEVLITHADPNKIRFVVAHTRYPESFTLVRLSGKAKKAKPAWFLFNTTPTTSESGHKVRYKRVPAEQVDKLMDPQYVMSAKIDGGLALIKLLKNDIRVLSHRTQSRTGRPIEHTARMAMEPLDRPLPKKYVGTTLVGELYGEREGKAIPPQELGSLLNSSVGKSLRRQVETGTKMRVALFGVQPPGRKSPWTEMSREEARKRIQELMGVLPKDVFVEPPYAYTEAEKRKLWRDVTKGRLPLTREGVVAFPAGGGLPMKVKVTPEAKVWVREIVPGKGKYEGRGAGTIRYSLEPEGEIVGEVGSGFDDETRERMHTHPEEFVGRVARIRSQGQFPSGAHRAPVFIALHEDYPVKKVAIMTLHKKMAIAMIKSGNPAVPILLRLLSAAPKLKYLRPLLRAASSKAGRQIALRGASAGAGYIYGKSLVNPNATQQTQKMVPLTSSVLWAAGGPYTVNAVRNLKIPSTLLATGILGTVPAYHATIGDVSKRRLAAIKEHMEPKGKALAQGAALATSQNPYPDLTRMASDVAKDVAEDWKPMFKATALESAKTLGRLSLFSTVPYAATKLLANVLLSRTQKPKDLSLAEADRYYKRRQRRQFIANALALAAGSAGGFYALRGKQFK